jgi:CheY-like chemotaxis protein
MPAIVLKQATGKDLRKLLTALTQTIGETLGSLINRPIAVKALSVELHAAADLATAMPGAIAAARGALDKDYAGRSLTALLDVRDAITMTGLLMMTPDHVIEQRRTEGELAGEDLEAFGELGNVLYSGIGNVLRKEVRNIDIRLQGHGVVPRGGDAKPFLGDARLVACKFQMKIGDQPESIGYLAIDVPTAEKWNKGPIEGVSESPETPTSAVSLLRADDEELDSIPAAPIRGTLAVFAADASILRTLRRSCRRVGLEVRRHARGEIPNPAAHRNEMVLLDVPPGDDRPFHWCRRIKEMAHHTPVVLLIHHPSRQRVTQAFLAQADVILGFPCEETQLSQKIEALLGQPARSADGEKPPAAS